MVKKLLIVLSIVASILVAEICFVVSHASASETSEPAEKVLDMTKGAEATGITAIIDETIVATEESIVATKTQPENVPTETELGCAELQESTANEEKIPAETAVVFLELTEAEKDMLLRIGMAEVGGEECTVFIGRTLRRINAVFALFFHADIGIFHPFPGNSGLVNGFDRPLDHISGFNVRHRRSPPRWEARSALLQ